MKKPESDLPLFENVDSGPPPAPAGPGQPPAAEEAQPKGKTPRPRKPRAVKASEAPAPETASPDSTSAPAPAAATEGGKPRRRFPFLGGGKGKKGQTPAPEAAGNAPVMAQPELEAASGSASAPLENQPVMRDTLPPAETPSPSPTAIEAPLPNVPPGSDAVPMTEPAVAVTVRPPQQQPQGQGGNQQRQHGQHPHHNRKDGGGDGEGGHQSRRESSRERRNKKKKNKERKKDVPTGPPIEGEGLLEISSKGFGFLRQESTNFQQAPSDIFVTPELVRTYGLRDGMWLKCISREGNRGPQLSEIVEICGLPPEKCKDLPYFEELTATNPNKRFTLETRPDLYTTRVVDLITPIGRGQRGLIVAPPRTGKTTLLQHMAEAIHANHEYVKIMILLVDERPEEVTELKRALPFADFMASSNDQDVKSHTRIAQLAIERAKRMVEAGEHVFLLLDSITRLARAFNNAMKGDKRGATRGGLAVGALEIPRRLFAAARNTREAGSLTIIGTALVETNSAMDEAIFQEFKGTGNMELVLDRKIAEQYFWPAVNIHASGTRREELLLAKHQLEKVYVIRRGLAGHKPVEAIQRILSLMERFKTNAQLLIEIKAQA